MNGSFETFGLALYLFTTMTGSVPDAEAKLSAALSGLSAEDAKLARALAADGQAHLFAAWPPSPEDDDRKRALLAQARALDAGAPGGGGLAAYAQRARALLADAKAGVNPLDGWVPKLATGETLALGTAEWDEREAKGLEEAGGVCFVLVAGGLGERLGYSGIKISLPSETVTGRSYLQLYARQILALQARSRAPRGFLPLAIMTSDDTHEATAALLADNANFGLDAPGQLTLIKQQKVPALADSDARLALEPDDAYLLQAKPHGHGDVHALLHSSGLAARWLGDGRSHVFFFQDTNAPAIVPSLAPFVGVSTALALDANSMCVPRAPGQEIGAVVRLESTLEPGRAMTVNVEYNQLDPLLRATVSPAGDAADPATGFSPYPGNINQLLFALPAYVATLDRTGGVMGEFVNPKYKDAARETFKKPTRLECMMQARDLPEIFFGRDVRSRPPAATPSPPAPPSPLRRPLTILSSHASPRGTRAGLPQGAAAVGERRLHVLRRRGVLLALQERARRRGDRAARRQAARVCRERRGRDVRARRRAAARRRLRGCARGAQGLRRRDGRARPRRRARPELCAHAQRRARGAARATRGQALGAREPRRARLRGRDRHARSRRRARARRVGARRKDRRRLAQREKSRYHIRAARH